MALALRPIASAAELPSVPWANGAGSTIELVSLDASAQLTPDLPRWRASIATLEQPAEFSALPGVRRIFRPIGSDLVLLIDGTRHAVADGQACLFDGASMTGLVELDRPCRAVNLMIAAPEAPVAAAEVVVAGSSSAPEPVVDGTFVLTLGDSHLGPGFTLLRTDEPAPGGMSEHAGVPVLRF